MMAGCMMLAGCCVVLAGGGVLVMTAPTSAPLTPSGTPAGGTPTGAPASRSGPQNKKLVSDGYALVSASGCFEADVDMRPTSDAATSWSWKGRGPYQIQRVSACTDLGNRYLAANRLANASGGAGWAAISMSRTKYNWDLTRQDGTVDSSCRQKCGIRNAQGQYISRGATLEGTKRVSFSSDVKNAVLFSFV